MIRSLPIVAMPIRAFDILRGLSLRLSGSASVDALSKALSGYLSARQVQFLNSGTSSFFIILKALQRLSPKKEVVLPAYTATSLITAVQEAGLAPVLCDISLDDFGLDARCLSGVISKDTLCVVAVHMFGLVSGACRDFKQTFPGVRLVEDCAQSFGSTISGKPTGSIGDAGFFSFARGKNLPTYGGGCIAAYSDELSLFITQEMREVPGRSLVFELGVLCRIAALALAINPCVYGLVYPFLRNFKEQAPSRDLCLGGYTAIQAAVALSLLRRMREFSLRRYRSTQRLADSLKGRQDIAVPSIAHGTEPACNRFPVLFKDLKKRDSVRGALWKAGIEASLMYTKPIHHLFDLGYREDEFPHACFAAGHVLTLPVHPGVSEGALERMIEVITR